MTGFLSRAKDLLLLCIFFLLMLLGQGAYFLLYPFYRGNRLVRVAWLVFLGLLAAGLSGYAALQMDARRHALPAAAGEREVIVPPGATLKSVSRTLKEKGLLRSELTFNSLALLRGESGRLQAGRYVFDGRQSPLELLDAMVRGDVRPDFVVIPEGATAAEIAGLFSRILSLDSSAMAALSSDTAFVRSLKVEGPTLEGYLFPDTYHFTRKPAPAEALSTLVRRFREVYDVLRERNKITRRFTEREVVTMASIVEAEAAVDGERGEIAGVFYNRLRKNIPLGADPTVRYVLGKPAGALTVSDLRVDSPYNTRRFPGLPPGPIGNPGRASLAAALWPANTRNLYFVAKADGSREHYFTASQAAHNRMKELARVNRKKSGEAAP